MRLLAVLPRFPFPLEKGDKLRAYHLLKGLSKDHELYLFALSDQPVEKQHFDEVASFCQEVVVFQQSKASIAAHLLRKWVQGWPLQMGYYYQSSAAKQLQSFVDRIDPDRIYFQLLRTAGYAQLFPGYAKTIDYMDAFAAGMQRRAEQSKGVTKWIWQSEANRLKAWEAKVYPWFDQHTVITQHDADLIHRPANSSIKVVSNGIDLDYFKPKPQVRKDIDLIFAGNMSYAPNVKAAQYLVNEIAPLLYRDFPDLSIALVGTDPHPSVQRLESNHVTVTGWVDDITDWYARAKIMLAPMQIGAGLQNKLLEAMAMGLPTVTSPLAQKAMPRQTEDFVGVADQPSDYADRVMQLLTDQNRLDTLGKAGQAYVRETHNWERIATDLSRYLSTAR